MNYPAVTITGAGLAGTEAALVLSSLGVPVDLYEMRPARMTPAHRTSMPAELVCSNSLKSMELPSAHALLKHELLALKSPLIIKALEHRVPAGSALAVDRRAFSSAVAGMLASCANIRLTRGELESPPAGKMCIIAAGPLASDSVTQWIAGAFSSASLSFYDAIAPIVSFDSINMNAVFSADRWESGEGDYINCPLNKEEYSVFYKELMEADRVASREFEDERFFEGCLPVEVMAGRGFDALRFGTMRPVGLTEPATGKRPYAVCQLRRENMSGESRGMVGFQTRLTQSSQKRVFRLIPGLANAEFLRFGSIHRNTYIDSPSLLSPDLSFRSMPEVMVAGQLCGNEGYAESIATGHLAARFMFLRLNGRAAFPPPPSTACGALLRHITASPGKPFVPSGINFGLIEPLAVDPGKKMGKNEKRSLICRKALADTGEWLKSVEP